MEKMTEHSYIWDVNNPNTPEQQLTPASPLCCLEYNPKDPHLLVGGSYNGLISCFDTRVGETPKDASIIEKSHRDPVYKVAWLQGKHPSSAPRLRPTGRCSGGTCASSASPWRGSTWRTRPRASRGG